MGDIAEGFGRAVRWGAFVATHAAITLLIIGAIQIIHVALEHNGDPMLFDEFPLHYILDGMDAVLLLEFAVFGFIEGVRLIRDA